MDPQGQPVAPGSPTSRFGDGCVATKSSWPKRLKANHQRPPFAELGGLSAVSGRVQHIIALERREGSMADGKEKQKKAVKRIRKAVRKAVSRGVTELEISRTVDATLQKPAKPKKAVKKAK
jgi:hypothetical protein